MWTWTPFQFERAADAGDAVLPQVCDNRALLTKDAAKQLAGGRIHTQLLLYRKFFVTPKADRRSSHTPRNTTSAGVCHV